MPFAGLPIVEFARPTAFLLVAAIPLILLLSRRRLRRAPAARQVAILGLRTALLLALIATLAEPFFRRPDDRLSVVFVLDASESAGGEAAARARLEEVRTLAGPEDRVAAVAFGDGAVVWQPFPGEDASPAANADRRQDESEPPEVPGPPTDGSDLAAGLRLAEGLAATEPGARIVVVSDGWAADPGLAALAERRVDALPVTAVAADPETITVGIEGPVAASGPILTRVDEPIASAAVVATTVEQSAVLRVTLDGRVATEIPVDLKSGTNRIPLDQRLSPAAAEGNGVHRLAIEVVAPHDTRPTNNRAEAVLIAKPRGRALLLEERQGEGEALRRALAQAGIEVRVRPAGELGDLPTLTDYDAIVLANVAATSFSLDQQKTLQEFVSGRGGGLIVAGGRTTFALGGYANTPIEAALPLSAEVPPRNEAASYALMLVLDRSSSMEAAVDGVKKIRMAAEAGVLATESLRPGDYVGVLAFDMRNQWVVPVQRAEDNGGVPAIQQRISALTADGGTQIYPAVKEGFEAIRNVPTESRHVILMSDGQSWGDGDWDALLAEFKAARVVLSTVAMGSDADRRLMSRLAQLGEGRYYFTERVRDLPRLITREATVARTSPIVEGLIQPVVTAISPILRSIAPSDLPAVGGYIAAMPKPSAEVVLASDRGDPLLAQWHYGLGRAVAWTGGLGEDWSGEWLQWDRYADFWGQAVRWAMPAPGNREFEPSVTLTGDRVTIRVDALQDVSAPSGPGYVDLADIRASVTTPDNRRSELRLRQTGPGRYEATAEAGPPGAYQVEVAQHSGADKVRSEWTGFVLPPDPEHARLGANDSLLRRLATEHGGRVVDSLAAAFDRTDLPPAQRSVPLWPWPLALAVLLLPIDIAARRWLP
ncbi:MAG TPA: VWA domain-containing protein [Dehalococcoidia bacterium]|nr:VWA domain-containing protein [Dehalococcoidia bacterium]